MARAAYTGIETLTFNDYLDLDTGRTLVAEPGGAYDITPASGRPVDDIPAGWFVPVQERQQPKAAEAEDGAAQAASDEPDSSGMSASMSER